MPDRAALPRQSTKQSGPSRGNVVAEVIEEMKRDLSGSALGHDYWTPRLQSWADRLSQAEQERNSSEQGDLTSEEPGSAWEAVVERLQEMQEESRDQGYERFWASDPRHVARNVLAALVAYRGAHSSPLLSLERRHLEALLARLHESSRVYPPEELVEARSIIQAALGQEDQ